MWDRKGGHNVSHDEKPLKTQIDAAAVDFSECYYPLRPHFQAVPHLSPRTIPCTSGIFPHSSPLSCRGNGMVYACLVASMKSNPPCS